MDVKVKLRRMMEERGWSEYRLSKAADLSQSTISNLFHRNNAPTISTLEAVCAAFGITLSQFFAEVDESISLTPAQRELLRRWELLTEEQQKALLELMNQM